MAMAGVASVIPHPARMLPTLASPAARWEIPFVTRAGNTAGATRACEATRGTVTLDTVTLDTVALDTAAWAMLFANLVANLVEAEVIRGIIPGKAPTRLQVSPLRASPLQVGNGTRIPIRMATPLAIVIALATAIVLIPSG